MGTVPSAAGGRLSEVQGVAAVEIFTRKCIKISGTATGHNGAAPFRAIKSCYIPKGINKYMETYRSGHNGAHSKKTRLCHLFVLANPLVIGLFATFECIFENFFLAVFSHFSFVCFNNFIWRCIEEVITRTTRNRFVGDEPARGFESHHLRQRLLGEKFSKEFSFYSNAELIACALTFLLSLSMWL